MDGLVGGVGWEAADHLLDLAQRAHRDATSLHDLHVFQSTEDFVLDHKGCFHLIAAAFLDLERLALQVLKRIRGGQVDGDIGPAFDFLETCMNEHNDLLFFHNRTRTR
jgi:hypothetical protein